MLNPRGWLVGRAVWRSAAAEFLGIFVGAFDALLVFMLKTKVGGRRSVATQIGNWWTS